MRGKCETLGCAVVTLVVIHALSGCEAGTSALPDAGAETSCVGGFYSLDDAGVVVTVAIECPIGTVCGSGLGYQICPGDGGAAVEGFGGEIAPESVVNARRTNANYPYCSTNEECNGICLFLPGCDDPTGLCCGPLCGADGVRPRADCASIDGCALVQCGCDGVTYVGLPTKPFAYSGSCNE